MIEKEETLFALKKMKDGEKLNEQEYKLVNLAWERQKKKLPTQMKLPSLTGMISIYENEVGREKTDKTQKMKRRKNKRRNRNENLKKMQRNYYENEREM